LNNENKESQIEIEKLKKDSKVFLILSVGAAAFFGLLVINFLVLSINPSMSLQKDSFLIGSAMSAIFGIFFAAFFVIKMRGKRKEIRELEKSYVQTGN
jgi:cell division protein FtsW (lipid II flippase)